MLNKLERNVMNTIYKKCGEEGSCLITLEEIALSLSNRHKISINSIENVIRSLELDDYLDVVFSEKMGKPILCVNLHSKGLSFKREMVLFRRDIYKKIMLALISGATTFLFGRFLFFIFK